MTTIQEIEDKSSELLNNLKVYISAPYQTKKDLVQCKLIEQEVSEIFGLSYSSSRLLDEKLRKMLVDADSDEKQQRIYAKNNLDVIQKIMESALVIVVINDRDNDPYRWLDIGIARTLGKMILLFSDNKNILVDHFNFPLFIVNDYVDLSKAVTIINDLYNKTPFIERFGSEIRFYPISDGLKINIQQSLQNIFGEQK